MLIEDFPGHLATGFQLLVDAPTRRLPSEMWLRVSWKCNRTEEESFYYDLPYQQIIYRSFFNLTSRYDLFHNLEKRAPGKCAEKRASTSTRGVRVAVTRIKFQR